MEHAAEGDRFDALRAALHAGRHEVAFRLFRESALGDGADGRVKAWLETAWRAFGTGDERYDFPQAIAAGRGDAMAALCLFARVSFGSGHVHCAIDALREATTGEPQAEAPAFLLCVMLLKLRHAEAQRWLQICLDRFNRPSSGWSDVGSVLLGLGKKEAALLCFARGHPDFATAMRRGVLARELGRRKEARQAFEEAVRLDAGSPRAWFLLGASAQDDRDLVVAIASYRRVLTLAPVIAEAAVNLGTALQESGDLAGAKVAYARALQTQPATFGRIAQALTTSPRGELWLDLDALRRSLAG